MTVEILLAMLRAHSAALQSSAWPRPHGPGNGPAFYLDIADTQALIAELTRVQRELQASRLGTPTSVQVRSRRSADHRKLQPNWKKP